MLVQKPTDRRRARHNRAEIQRLLDEYHRSGLTQGQYAARLGIALSTLTRWLRQARGDTGPLATPPLNLVEVALRPAPAALSGGIYQIELPGGVRLRLEGAWQDQHVRQLLTILSRP